MSRLLDLYPPAWRERYLAEMPELLAAHPATTAARLDLVAGAIDAWIHPQVRRPSAEAASDGPVRRAAAGAALLGGVLFAVSGLLMASSRELTPEGYQDNGVAVPLLILAMILTAIAGPALASGGRPARLATVMVGGALAMLAPWPILIIAFFTYIGATIALGALLLSRSEPIGLAPIAIGVILPSFNFETDWALAAIPVGVLWVVYAAASLRSRSSVRPANQVRRAEGLGG